MATLFKLVQDSPEGEKRPLLTVARILGWAVAHQRATGQWPARRAGRVRETLFFETWHAIDAALASGARGLPGGHTLAGLLREHIGLEPGMSVEEARARAEECQRMLGGRRKRKGALSFEQILAWGDAHHAATGLWPSLRSGEVAAAPGETWSAINTALKEGRRGLPSKTTLSRLLVQHRGPEAGGSFTALDVEQILAWADAYHQEHGCWPDQGSGPVAGASNNSWSNINILLRRGGRGLPGGSSLVRLLGERRGRKRRQPGQIIK